MEQTCISKKKPTEVIKKNGGKNFIILEWMGNSNWTQNLKSYKTFVLKIQEFPAWHSGNKSDQEP